MKTLEKVVLDYENNNGYDFNGLMDEIKKHIIDQTLDLDSMYNYFKNNTIMQGKLWDFCKENNADGIMIEEEIQHYIENDNIQVRDQTRCLRLENESCKRQLIKINNLLKEYKNNSKNYKIYLDKKNKIIRDIIETNQKLKNLNRLRKGKLQLEFNNYSISDQKWMQQDAADNVTEQDMESTLDIINSFAEDLKLETTSEIKFTLSQANNEIDDKVHLITCIIFQGRP